MRDQVYVRKINNVYIKLECERDVIMALQPHFTFEVPGAKFSPAYKNKMWDGRLRLLSFKTQELYFGLLSKLAEICNTLDIEMKIDPELLKTRSFSSENATELSRILKTSKEPRDYQAEAVSYCLTNKRALLLSPTASGKSFIIYLLTRFHQRAGKRVLIIVPFLNLVSQLGKDFYDYNNGQSLPIHQITGGVDKNVFADIVITTWQSVQRMPAQWFNEFDTLIVDEAHMFKAKVLTGIVEKTTDLEDKYGFTGSLDDSETNKLVLEGLFGPVHRVAKTKELMDKGTLAALKIKALVFDYKMDKVSAMEYFDEMDFICRSESRNNYIKNLANSLTGNTLILFQFVEKHGKVLYELLQKLSNKKAHFIHGGISTEERERIREAVESSNDNIIIASYGTYSTGVNIVNLDNLIFASPSKSKIRNLQSIGRLLRKSDSKSYATLYDIVDNIPLKKGICFCVKHFKERARIYDEEGFVYKIYKVDLKWTTGK